MPTRPSWIIDINNDYCLVIDPYNLKIVFMCNNAANPNFYKKFFEKIKIDINNETIILVPILHQSTYYQELLHVHFPLEITVAFEGNLAYAAMVEQFNSSPQEKTYFQLTVSETRQINIGTFSFTNPDNYNFPLNFKFKTDLHTHYDAVLPTKTLIKLALRRNIPLDIESLKRNLDVEFLAERYSQEFIAIWDLRKKFPEIYHKFKNSLNIASGRTIDFFDLEKIYNLRDFITGNINLFKDILDLMGQYYHNYGVQYAEISMHDIIKQEWYEIAAERLPTVENKYGVKIRFLVALYNYQNPDEVFADITKIKMISHLPYLVGLDFAGHEQYSLYDKSITHHIKDIAQWIQKNNLNFIVRVHAGETNLHNDNVKLVLTLAIKYNIRFRIGHGIHGLDNTAKSILKKTANRVTIEFNPDSNIALNNITNLSEIPIKDIFERNIPIVIGSDGAGIYNTDYKQLSRSAVEAGASLKVLLAINAFEESYIEYQDKIFHQKLTIHRNKTEPCMIFHSPTPLSQGSTIGFQNRSTLLDTHFSRKRPIYIAGNACVTSINLNPDYLKTIIYHFSKLIVKINPKNFYFIFNFPNTEMSILVCNIVRLYNSTQTESERKFTIKYATPKHLKNRSQKIDNIFLGESFTDFPQKMVDYIHHHQGIIIYIGGDAITADTILSSLNLGEMFVLLTNAIGTTDQYKNISKYNFDLTSKKDLIKFIAKLYPFLSYQQEDCRLDTKALQPNKLILLSYVDYLGFLDYKTINDWRTRSRLWYKICNLVIEDSKQILSTLNFRVLSNDFLLVVVKLLLCFSEVEYFYAHYENALQALSEAYQAYILLTDTDTLDTICVLADIHMMYGKITTYCKFSNSELLNLISLKTKKYSAHKILPDNDGYLHLVEAERLYEKIKSEKITDAILQKIKWYKYRRNDPLGAAHIMERIDRSSDRFFGWQNVESLRDIAECIFLQPGLRDMDQWKDADQYLYISKLIYGMHENPQEYNAFSFLYMDEHITLETIERDNASNVRLFWESHLTNIFIEDYLFIPPIDILLSYFGLMLYYYKQKNDIITAKIILDRSIKFIEFKKIDHHHIILKKFNRYCTFINTIFQCLIRLFTYSYFSSLKIETNGDGNVLLSSLFYNETENFIQYLININVKNYKTYLTSQWNTIVIPVEEFFYIKNDQKQRDLQLHHLSFSVCESKIWTDSWMTDIVIQNSEIALHRYNELTEHLAKRIVIPRACIPIISHEKLNINNLSLYEIFSTPKPFSLFALFFNIVDSSNQQSFEYDFHQKLDKALKRGNNIMTTRLTYRPHDEEAHRGPIYIRNIARSFGFNLCEFDTEHMHLLESILHQLRHIIHHNISLSLQNLIDQCINYLLDYFKNSSTFSQKDLFILQQIHSEIKLPDDIIIHLVARATRLNIAVLKEDGMLAIEKISNANKTIFLAHDINQRYYSLVPNISCKQSVSITDYIQKALSLHSTTTSNLISPYYNQGFFKIKPTKNILPEERIIEQQTLHVGLSVIKDF